MLYSINSLPRPARNLPGFAVGAFIEHANIALRADLPEKDAIAVGMSAAGWEIEKREQAEGRTDRAARVARVDRVSLRLDAATVEHHENGWIDVWGVATRVGVFDYDDPAAPDGIFREYRPPEEVLSADSLATLHGVPFTVDHPTAGDVTSTNARDLTHGWVLAVKVDGDLVWTKIRVATDEALAAIQAGKLELSCGYTLRLESAPGGMTPDGEPYDAIQRDIRYNHLALVDMARAGHVARLRFDSARVQRAQSTPKRAHAMKITVHYDGKAYTLPSLMLPGLRAAHIETARDAKRGDIKTARLRVEMEGDEPTELVLPESMVTEMLTMLTGGAAPAAEETTTTTTAEPEGDAEPEPAAAPPPEQMPGAPTDEPESEDMMGKKHGDSVKREDVAAMIGEALEKERVRSDAAMRHRAKVERQASTVLDLGYAYDGHTTEEIQAETIAKAMPGRADHAKDLQAKAKRGDARSAGALDALFEVAVQAAADARADEAERATSAHVTVANDAGRDKLPKHEQIRLAKIDARKLGRDRHADDTKTA